VDRLADRCHGLANSAREVEAVGMTVILNPYLNFQGAAREALDFYHTALGGELSVLTFAEMGDPYPGWGDKVMHGQIDAPGGITLMASDVPDSVDFTPGADNFAVSLSGAHFDEAQLRGYWDSLSDGATITQPLSAAPWGATFGVLRDRFGVVWVMNISAEG
jgi:PhnB protein